MDFITVRISAAEACFPRPEMKDERISYPVPTASALRMILNAVYWKPRFNWEPVRLRVIHRGSYATLMRNELKSKSFGKPIDYVTNHTQRKTTFLKDVEYEVQYRLVWNKNYEHRKEDEPDDLTKGKHFGILKRRLENGQYFRKPYAGLREFPASVVLSDGSSTSGDAEDWSEKLGLVFHGIDRGEGYYSGMKCIPCFQDSVISHGVIAYLPGGDPSLYRTGFGIQKEEP